MDNQTKITQSQHIGHLFIEQQQILNDLQYHKTRHQFYIIWIYLYYCIFLTISSFILYYSICFLDVFLSDYTHITMISHAPFWIVGVYLVSMFFMIGYSDLKAYFDAQYIIKKINAQPLVENAQSAEELKLFALNHKIADFLNTEPIAIYILYDESSINAFSYTIANQNKIILTWGSVFYLDEIELLVLLYRQYYFILSGESKIRSHVYHLLTGYTGLAQWSWNQLQAGYKRLETDDVLIYSSGRIVMAWLIYQLSFLDLKWGQFFKYFTLHYREKALEHLITSHLSSTIAYARLLIKLDSAKHLYFHSIGQFQLDVLGFAKTYPTLFAIHLSPAQRLSKLSLHYSTLYDFDDDCDLFQHQGISKLSGIFYSIKLMLGADLTEIIPPLSNVWKEQLRLVYLMRDSQHAHLSRDLIRPLNPVLREKMVQEQYFKKIFRTQAHFLHSLTLVLILRKNPELIQHNLDGVDISATICENFKGLDERLYIEIFKQCCSHIHLPKSLAYEYLQTWQDIIQQNNEVSLLDALLFEKLKAQVGVLPAPVPYQRKYIIDDIITLLDSILFIQPHTEFSLDLRNQMIELAFGQSYLQKYKNGIPHRTIQFSVILHRVAGLDYRDRLMLLNMIELLLWDDGVLTQEGLDVLVLLAWRLGLESHGLEKRVYRRSQLSIV